MIYQAQDVACVKSAMLATIHNAPVSHTITLAVPCHHASCNWASTALNASSSRHHLTRRSQLATDWSGSCSQSTKSRDSCLLPEQAFAAWTVVAACLLPVHGSNALFPMDFCCIAMQLLLLLLLLLGLLLSLLLCVLTTLAPLPSMLALTSAVKVDAAARVRPDSSSMTCWPQHRRTHKQAAEMVRNIMSSTQDSGQPLQAVPEQ